MDISLHLLVLAGALDRYASLFGHFWIASQFRCADSSAPSAPQFGSRITALAALMRTLDRAQPATRSSLRGFALVGRARYSLQNSSLPLLLYIYEYCIDYVLYEYCTTRHYSVSFTVSIF